MDPTIKPKWVDALKFNHGVLEREKAIPPLDFNEWITEDFVKVAYKELGKDYMAEKNTVVDPAVANAGLPLEIWHSRDGISSYETFEDFLTAINEFRSTGAKLNATYVYDKETGLKLFGKTAFFVKSKDGFETFLRKPDADKYAATVSGEVVDIEAALTSLSAKVAMN